MFAAVLLLFISLGVPAAWAQATPNPPGKMSYQGFLTDNNGVPLGVAAPINRDTIFRIFSAPAGGILKWSEQQTVTIDKGYFTVLLGEGSAVGSEPNTNNLAALFAGSDASERYIEITLKSPGGGSDVTITPRVQFLASPYSFLARQANSITGTDGTALLTTFGSSVGINKPNPASPLDVGGTVTATAFSGDGGALTGLNGANFQAGSIGPAPLAAGSVTTPKLADGSVTTEKIADGSVTAGKLVPGALPIPLYAQFVSSQGGVAAAGANQRGRFTVVTNEIPGVSASTHPDTQFTLPAGTYYARISAAACRVGAHQAVLRKTGSSGTAITLVGTLEYSADFLTETGQFGQTVTSTPQITTRSVIEGQFILTATTTMSVYHYMEKSSPVGRGVSAGNSSHDLLGNTGTSKIPEIHAMFNLWRLH